MTRIQLEDEIRRKRRRSLELIYKLSPPEINYRIIRHPRYFNKPLRCRSGFHQWETKVLMNIPILYCKKCGAFAIKGSYEGTYTKRELRQSVLPPFKPRSLEEIIEDVWEQYQRNGRR